MYCKKCKKLFLEGEKACPICKEPLVADLHYYACQLKNGDETAFNEIYHSTRNYTRKVVLYQFAVHSIDSSHVEDCMQEIYLRLHQKIELFDDTKATFSTWFETLRKNAILNFCEKMKKSQAEISQDQSEILKCEDISKMPEHLSDNDEIAAIVNEMIDQLPEEQRICIRKFYMEEMKQDDIAKELGIPLGTVKSRLSKGKEKIGEMVLELQKKGKKIYSFSPILLFWWFFQNCSEECLAAEGTLPATDILDSKTVLETDKVLKEETIVTENNIEKNQAVESYENIKTAGTAKAARIGGMSMAKMISVAAVTCLVVVAAVGIAIGAGKSDTAKTTTEEVVSEDYESAEVEAPIVDEESKETEANLKQMLSPKIDITQYESYGWGNGYMLPILQDGLWGLVDYEGNVILEPSYEEYYYFPNEDGYAIFRDAGVFHIVGKDGVIHTYQDDIELIRIGEGNIVTYSTKYTADNLAFCSVYEKLDGTEVYRIDYNYVQDYLSEDIDEYIDAYSGCNMPFNNGKAYVPKTHNGNPAIVELSLDGTNKLLEIYKGVEHSHRGNATYCPTVITPIGSCSGDYVMCHTYYISGITLLNTETLEKSERLVYVSTGLFSEIDWESWYTQKIEENPMYERITWASEPTEPNFANYSYDGFEYKPYYSNGNKVYNYEQHGCVSVMLPEGITKDVLFDYYSVSEEGRLESCIAIYDEILFDNFDYLAVRNGTEWFYIDYQGNVVSESYKDATPFNDEGYALVLEDDGNAYVINQAFEVMESVGEASDITTCGEMFKVDNEFVFYYGEKYL